MEHLENEFIGKLVESLVILAIGLIIFFGLKGRILRFAEWANLPRLAFTPVRALLRYAVLAASLILVLTRWGFELNGVLAALGAVLGLVAIGFVAVWSVLSNFLCTFVLIVFKPFSVGDELEIPSDNVRGKVVDLTLLFTTLRHSDGEHVVIPNNMFFQKIFRRREGTETKSLDEQLRSDRPASVR